MHARDQPTHRPTRAACSAAVAALALVAGTVVGAGPLAAQPPPTVPTTTGSAGPPSVPPSLPPAVPPAGSPGDPSAVDPGVTTTVDPLAPTTVPDPLAAASEGLSAGAYATQLPFDPASNAVLSGELGAARKALAVSTKRLTAVQEEIAATVGEFQRLSGRIEVIGTEREDKVADAANAKASLRRRAVAAYVRGDQSSNVIAVMGDPVDYSRATSYLQALAGDDRKAFLRYQEHIAEMTAAERELADDQAALELRVDALVAERDVALQEVLDDERCVDAFQRGSHVCVDGFRFPVLGTVNFIDSWGFPRLPFTPDQHWHEGTDIMAPFGREVVAVEPGTLFKVGDQGLGGLRLWLHGDSGTDYYYAHFSSIAPGMVEGTRVSAGAVLGFVGNSGDASGGPPHVHFEIHPAGGLPVNPFPLLRATWGDRPMPLESAVIAGVPRVTSTLPIEETAAGEPTGPDRVG